VKPRPKDKLTAVVCKDLHCMGFLINSAIHPFILKRPDLLASQVKIKVSDYKCLQHDSYIDCIDLLDFSDAELSNNERDPINIVTKAKIRKAVADSKTITNRFKRLILYGD
jgi:hypothetical protein